jgi:hypothetical protein
VAKPVMLELFQGDWLIDHYQQRHHLFNLDLDHHCTILKYIIKLSSIHEDMEKCQYKYDKKSSI